MSRHKPLADEAKVIDTFAGFSNAKRTKDIGHKGLTLARNVEITDTKKLVRREGYTLLDGSAFTAVYGNQPQDQLYAVKAGSLVRIDPDNTQHVLTTGLLGDIFCWDEDAAGNIFYTSNKGSNGMITVGGQWQQLELAIPSIVDAGVVEPGTWEYRPFNLGAKYTQNAMQLMATYLTTDGRESAPSETVTIEVKPEIEMIRVTLPMSGARARIYATAPGGSTYYLIAETDRNLVTIPVKNMNMTATGVAYEESLALGSFPHEANVLAFFNGVLYASSYNPATMIGTVYWSQPLRPHLFALDEDFVGVAGCPLLILPFSEGLIIGTDQMVYRYVPKHLKASGSTAKEGLSILAPYGVVPGICGAVDARGTAWFWTRRGPATATINDKGYFEYELLGKDMLSVDPGVFSHAHLFEDRGYVKLVASTISGNQAFNAWTER